MAKRRFKIDISPYIGGVFKYALFREEVSPGAFGRNRIGWEFISSFTTTAEAHEYYEGIKDLPEYLD